MQKRIIAILLALVMVLGLAACGKSNNTEPANTVDPAAEQKRFADFVTKQYIYSIESDYSTAHIYYSDWAAAGLNRDNIEISFGEIPSESSMKEDREYYQGLQKELDTFDRTLLTPLQQDEYDALVWEIGSVLAMCDEKFDYYGQFFTPPNSLESNIAALFTSWELRNAQDARDVVTLINSLPAYIDGCLAYAKKQQEKNLLMTNFEEVQQGCQDIIDSGLDSYAIKCVLDQLEKLTDLSQDEKAALKEQILAAFRDSYLPSITKIRDTFKEISGGNNVTGSYASLPNGKEYYSALLNYKTGLLGKDPDEVFKELQDAMNVHYKKLVEVYNKAPFDANAYYDGKGNSGYKDYTEILEDVKVKMLADHPEVKNLKYEIQSADPEEKLEEKSIAAYFIIPPVDGDHLQRMRVAPSNTNIGSIDTYMTVTHEGFPGHMYQYAYAAENIPSDYIKTLGVDSVVEGYAVYSQYHALEYLKKFNNNYKDFAMANEQYSYAVYSAVDIGINYKGWDLTQTAQFLTNSGFSVDEGSTKSIYDLLRLNTCYYLPYGYGFEMLQGLRDIAEKDLGDKFSALEFNRALLDAGPSPLSVVTNHINKYIDSVKGPANESK